MAFEFVHPSSVLAGELVNSEGSYLLGLPQELRDMIYTYLFDDASELHMWHPITRVSRSTRMDAAQILNSKLSGCLYFTLETPSNTPKTCWWKHCLTDFSLNGRFILSVCSERPASGLDISTFWGSATEHWQEVIICCFDEFYRLELTVRSSGTAVKTAHAIFFLYGDDGRFDLKNPDLVSDRFLTYKWSEETSKIRVIRCNKRREFRSRSRQDEYMADIEHKTSCACCPSNGVPSMFIDKVASWPTDITPASLAWINRAVADFYTSCRDSTRQPLR